MSGVELISQTAYYTVPFVIAQKLSFPRVQKVSATRYIVLAMRRGNIFRTSIVLKVKHVYNVCKEFLCYIHYYALP